VSGSAVRGRSPDGGPHEDRPASSLDDTMDREELRNRYYGLLEELRTMLPGVQVLVAFLLTVPFAAKFDQLDDLGRTLFGGAILSSITSVTCMLTPTAFHRVAERTQRSVRLLWGIRVVKAGIAALAVALLSSLMCVARFVFGGATAVVMTAAMALLVAALWLLLPLSHRVR
jgi:hypothetical protein